MFLTSNVLHVQSQTHIDPPGWWADLEDGRVEVLISSPTIQDVADVVSSEQDVVLESWRPASLLGHVWATLDASRVTAPQDVTISVKPLTGRAVKVDWHVEPQLDANKRLDRWDEAPVMYLIMPDRFANGDVENDDVKGMLERGTNRSEMYKRHGGDLAGVTSKMDYLAELGVGAVWMTPVVENDLARTSYHGYACTDSYSVDPRLGTLDDYKNLTREAHARGIRVVHDWVPNHWGNLHRLLTLPVDSSWVHQWRGGWEDSKRTNYRSGTVVDPHAQDVDVSGFNEGWFDRMMPDMNQLNPVTTVHGDQHLVVDGRSGHRWPANRYIYVWPTGCHGRDDQAHFRGLSRILHVFRSLGVWLSQTSGPRRRHLVRLGSYNGS